MWQKLTLWEMYVQNFLFESQNHSRVVSIKCSENGRITLKMQMKRSDSQLDIQLNSIIPAQY